MKNVKKLINEAPASDAIASSLGKTRFIREASGAGARMAITPAYRQPKKEQINALILKSE